MDLGFNGALKDWMRIPGMKLGKTDGSVPVLLAVGFRNRGGELVRSREVQDRVIHCKSVEHAPRMRISLVISTRHG
jgi:hypothetical protein